MGFAPFTGSERWVKQIRDDALRDVRKIMKEEMEEEKTGMEWEERR